MELGICMKGLEECVEHCIDYTMSDDFSYLEIGVALGGTFQGVVKYASERSKNPLLVGVDKVDGWSLSVDTIKAWLKDVVIDYKPKVERCRPIVFLCGVDELMCDWKHELSLCLVDGCHSKKCCIKDFSLIEKHMKPGGIVMFHDAGRNQLGSSIQPCCGECIGVYYALGELGLIDGTLNGWSKCEFVHGKEASMAITRRL